MGTEKRNSYRKNLKECNKACNRKSRKPTEVARDLGIHENLIYNWKKKYLDKQDAAFTGQGKTNSKDEYIRKLEQENRRLKDERDILKKAAIFFEKDP